MVCVALSVACENDLLFLDLDEVRASVSDGIVGQPTSISVLLPVLEPPGKNQGAEIEITIRGPNSGADVTIDRDPDGTYVGTYIPETIGVDSVYVGVNANVIPASPLISRVRLSGFGSATIDGVMQPGEWNATSHIPVFAGDAVEGTLHVMNDETNLYLALRVPDPSLEPGDLMRVRFDNGANSAPDIGDDELHATTAGLADLHYNGTAWGESDANQDGVAAAADVAGEVVIEVSHPLDSGDPDDFSLDAGRLVGFCLTYFDDGQASEGSTFPRGCNVAANFQGHYGRIIIAAPPAN